MGDGEAGENDGDSGEWAKLVNQCDSGELQGEKQDGEKQDYRHGWP